MAPTIFSNMSNGFSGIAIFMDLYYALFNVLLTTITVASYILLDQEIYFAPDSYKQSVPKKKRAASYDPTRG